MNRIKVFFLSFLAVATIALMSGCASPNTMLSKAQYEKLWSKGISKASKGKRLHPDWLRGMEIAYHEMQRQDSLRVVMLFKRKNKQAWNDIIEVADRVDYRQNQLQRVIPIYDKSGRRGNFDFMDVKHWKENAGKALTADFMQDALKFVNDAERNGDRKAAIKAVKALEGAREFNSNIPGWDESYNKAIRIATVSVNFDVSEGRGYFPDQMIFERKLKEALNASPIPFLDIHFKSGRKTDYKVALDPRDIVVSPPEELVHEKSYDREITLDGKKVKVWNETDSIWEYKNQKVKERVSANLQTITQVKRARGQIRYVVYADMQSKSLSDRTLDAMADFDHVYYRIDGDERAIDRNISENDPIPYPSDFEMVARVHDALIMEILNHIEKWDWWL